MRLSSKQQQWLALKLERLGGYFVRLIGRSLRLEVLGWNRIQHLLRHGKPIVFQFWHGEMFIAWYVTSPFRPAAIVSQAGDGDIASAVLTGLDFVTFRGSSTRGGRKAFSQMVKYLRDQKFKVSAFASDGPKGPAHQMKPGTYVTAQHLNGYVVPVATNSKWKIKTGGWDKFFLPLPFSRAVISFGKPIPANKDLNKSALDVELTRVSVLCKTHQENINRHYHNEALDPA